MTTSSRRRYHAAPQRQTATFQGKLIGCTDTAMAMLVDAATLGGCLVKEHDVRLLSGEAHPDPASPGLSLTQLEAVGRKLHVAFDNRTGDSWAKLVAATLANHRVVAQLWYADMGGGSIGHAFYVEQVRGDKAYVVDPIKGAYAWVSAARLRKAMTSFAQQHGLHDGGLFWGCSRRTQFISVNQEPQKP